MTLEPTWRFRRMERDEPGIDPVQEEFFSEALAKTRKAQLVTGNSEFSKLEPEIRLIRLQQIERQAIISAVGDLPAGMHATGMAD